MYITTRQKKKYILTTGAVLAAFSFVILLAVFLNTIRGGVEPMNVLFSNITPTSATITWVTESKVDSVVNVYKDGDKVGEFTDPRGRANLVTHYVEIKDLEPQSKYTFEIISGGERYLRNEGRDFAFTTAPLIGNSPAPNIIAGKVSNIRDSDVLVFFVSDEFPVSPLSTYVSSTGEWSLDISSLRSVDLDRYVGIDSTADTRIKLLFFGRGGSEIIVGNNNTLFDGDRFLSNITLGDDVNVFASINDFSGMVMGETDSQIEGEVLEPEDEIQEEPDEQETEPEPDEEDSEVKWEPLF